MPNPIHLLFGIHCHQPVGNFDHVLEAEFERAYAPFLLVAEDFPDFHFACHYSGWLLEWIANHHPDFIDKLGRMVARGQVELMAGGFYEPVLSAIPRRDRRGQIEMHQDFLRTKLGARARGAWLTERVWEPELVSDLVACGIDYVTVDDYHFQCAGFDREQLTGYFFTEDAGARIGVFPIDMELRYLTPFQPTEKAVDYVLERRAEYGWPAVTIADDGEKYGTWPGTHKLVYEEGWLRRFMTAVCEHELIQPSTFSEYRAAHHSQGLVYLPNASYFEMSEWSLPAAKAVGLTRLVEEEKRRGDLDAVKPFISGGIWKGFLVKYPESNRMHKRAIALSARLDGATGEAVDEARRHLYAGQANDAYWHGVFGGLYLPHLRHTIWHHLNRAEACLGAVVPVDEWDEDADGYNELHLANDHLHATINLAAGGLLSELSDLASGINFGATIARRFEHYHVTASPEPEVTEDDAVEDDAEAVQTIHDIAGRAMAEARDELVYDVVPPLSGRVRVLAAQEPNAPRVVPGGEPPGAPAPLRPAHRDGDTVVAGLSDGLTSDSRYELLDGRAALRLTARLRGGRPSDSDRAGIELYLAMPGCDSPATHLTWAGQETQPHGLHDPIEAADVTGLTLTDESVGRRIVVTFAAPATVAVAPMRTVSQSEAGVDVCYQQSWVMATWPLGDTPEIDWQQTITMEITDA
ncbi:MAG: DUF1926 domain-containing protein [Nitrospirota bacterium]|jgi:hypothetical protein